MPRITRINEGGETRLRGDDAETRIAPSRERVSQPSEPAKQQPDAKQEED